MEHMLDLIEEVIERQTGLDTDQVQVLMSDHNIYEALRTAFFEFVVEG